MIRWTVCLLAICGCATSALHPSEIEVEEIEYGVYVEVEGQDVLVTRTTEIPCRGDAKFGMKLRISYPEGRSVRLPLRVELREPAIPDKRPSSQIYLDEDMHMPKGLPSFEMTVTDEFKGDFELVDGEYQLRLIEPETGLAYHSRIFTLRNCEGRPPHNKPLNQTGV